MKSILISIKPQWVEKILNGEKTIEIRSTVPKEWKEYLRGMTSIKPAPSKWYIYCTKAKPTLQYFYNWGNYKPINEYSTWAAGSTVNAGEYGNGKIVAEFTLNKIETSPSIRYKANGAFYQYNKVSDEILKKSCLTQEQILHYTNGNNLYALHIEDLEIYTKPKELSQFSVGKAKIDCGYGNYNIYNKILKRPPQSWCHVESLEGE